MVKRLCLYFAWVGKIAFPDLTLSNFEAILVEICKEVYDFYF